MSKKQKRQVSQRSAGAAPARPAATTTTTSFSRKPLGMPDFTPDYSHVVSDLKRIGMLAGSFFVVLIVLSFFLK